MTYQPPAFGLGAFHISEKIMAATGKEKLYVSSEGGGRAAISAQEVADLADASYTLPDAAPAERGGVLQGAAVVDATDGEDVVDQLNALLASLRASGAIAS